RHGPSLPLHDALPIFAAPFALGAEAGLHRLHGGARALLLENVRADQLPLRRRLMQTPLPKGVRRRGFTGLMISQALGAFNDNARSEEHTSELQSPDHL